MRDQIDFIYRAGDVTRFHTMVTLRPQTLGHHQWHVAMLAHVLYGQDEPGLTPAFLMACLTHDMSEEKFGDMPAPAKRDLDEPFPDFREKYGELEQLHLSKFGMDWEKFLTEEEKRRLKFCDSMEGLLHCVGERALGNKQITGAFRNFRNYVGQLLEDIPDVPLEKREPTPAEREWELFNYAVELWRHANG